MYNYALCVEIMKNVQKERTRLLLSFLVIISKCNLFIFGSSKEDVCVSDNVANGGSLMHVFPRRKLSFSFYASHFHQNSQPVGEITIISLFALCNFDFFILSRAEMSHSIHEVISSRSID